MTWVVISLAELVAIAILVSAFGSQEKKYEAALQEKMHCIECAECKTEHQHEKYLEMAEKNWYLSQRNKSLITILTIAKEQPDILQMEYMDEFLKEEDGER